MIEGSLIEAKAQSELDLDVVHAGPFHLPVGQILVELDDRGEGKKRRRDARTAVVLAVHRLELVVLDQWGDKFTKSSVETIGRDETVADLISVVETSFFTRKIQHVVLFAGVSLTNSTEETKIIQDIKLTNIESTT